MERAGDGNRTRGSSLGSPSSPLGELQISREITSSTAFRTDRLLFGIRPCLPLRVARNEFRQADCTALHVAVNVLSHFKLRTAQQLHATSANLNDRPVRDSKLTSVTKSPQAQHKNRYSAIFLTHGVTAQKHFSANGATYSPRLSVSCGPIHSQTLRTRLGYTRGEGVG